MPDCFISYDESDVAFASAVRRELESHGLDVFLAAASLQPGDHWSDRILESLRASKWVLFLASADACRSPHVLQELGVALGAEKRLIPVVWDMAPDDLPGWAKQAQALVLTDQSLDQLRTRMAQIADAIKQEKLDGWLILGAIVVALLVAGGRGSQ